MDKVILKEFVIPFKGISKKTIYHFSDSHLTEYDAESDVNEIEHSKKQTTAWEGVRKGFCEAYGCPYGELEMQTAQEHLENLLSCASDGDALVIAGDTMDYINGANLRISEKLFGGFKKPFVQVCGNHEPHKDIPDGYIVSRMKSEIQTLDLGDMIVIGLDNSQRKITRSQLDTLKGFAESGKPMLLVMHVPIMNDENRELLLKSGVYFQLNYDGCPEENLEFIEFIKANGDNIVAVLAGHLHYSNISRICDKVTQYVTSQGVTGNIHKYVIGE